MKKCIKILFVPFAIIAVMVGITPVALASPAPLDVQFNPNPLFNKQNFLPFDQTSGDATVTNNSGTTQIIQTEAINIFDNDNFGSLLHLKITGSNGILFDGSLADFFSTTGALSLGSIGSGETRSFTYTVSFVNSNDNSYQGKTLGFDMCVGFQGGNSNCGSTTVGEESGGNDGSGGGVIPGSGGSGGGSIATGLFIFNEQALNISNVGQSGSATVTWETNLLSTSQVVYGLASGGPYSLVLVPPNFGYPFATAENLTKTTRHSLFLAGLVPGETYVYRVISRASPPTVSIEHRFTVPLLAQAENQDGVTPATISYAGNRAVGGSVGNEAPSSIGEGIGTSTEETVATTSNPQLAAALFGLPPGFFEFFQSFSCVFTALLILFGIVIAWMLLSMWRDYKENMPSHEYRKKQIQFFTGGILLALVYALIWRTCIVIPLFVVLIALVAWFVWNQYSANR